MEDKQVVIRQTLGLKTTTPAVAASNASGMSMSGHFIGDGVDVVLGPTGVLYGNQFEQSDTYYGIRCLNDMYVAGTFNVRWGGSFWPRRAKVEIWADDGEGFSQELASEHYAVETEPSGATEGSSGAFGPVIVPGGTVLHVVILNMPEDPEYVELGALWQAPAVYVPPGS